MLKRDRKGKAALTKGSAKDRALNTLEIEQFSYYIGGATQYALSEASVTSIKNEYNVDVDPSRPVEILPLVINRINDINDRLAAVPAGATGATGPSGSNGSNGSNGSQGPQGATGPMGEGGGGGGGGGLEFEDIERGRMDTITKITIFRGEVTFLSAKGEPLVQLRM